MILESRRAQIRRSDERVWRGQAALRLHLSSIIHQRPQRFSSCCYYLILHYIVFVVLFYLFILIGVVVRHPSPLSHNFCEMFNGGAKYWRILNKWLFKLLSLIHMFFDLI